MASTPIRKGYLKVKSNLSMQRWMKRYCEIDGAFLLVYASFIRGASDNTPMVECLLQKDKKSKITLSGSEFIIDTQKHIPYKFQANNNHTAAMWVKAIEEASQTEENLRNLYGDEYDNFGTAARRKRITAKSKEIEAKRKNAGSDMAFDVVVPAGKQPGDKIKIEKSGRIFTVEIPAGVYEGHTFEVRFNIMSPVSADETIQHAGWMYKYPRKGIAPSKKKWFVLTDKTLCYMDQEGMSAKMVWDMKTAEISAVGSSDLSFTSGGETVKFGCMTNENLRTWMNRLQLCMNKAKPTNTRENAVTDIDGESMVGKIVTGQPLIAGWIDKLPTKGVVGSSKKKWFTLMKHMLYYSDLEGSPIKREWDMGSHRVLFSTNLTHAIGTINMTVVNIQANQEEIRVQETLNLQFNGRSEALRWYNALSRAIVMRELECNETKVTIPDTYAGGGKISHVLNIPVPPTSQPGNIVEFVVHGKLDEPERTNDDEDDGASPVASPTSAKHVLAVAYGLQHKLVTAPRNFSGLVSNIEKAFKLKPNSFRLDSLSGKTLTNIDQVKLHYEIKVVDDSSGSLSSEPSRVQVPKRMDKTAVLDNDVVEWLTQNNLTIHKEKLLAHNLLSMAAISGLKSSDLPKLGFKGAAGRQFLQKLPGNSPANTNAKRSSFMRSPGSRAPASRFSR